jgi:hypothetical protein
MSIDVLAAAAFVAFVVGIPAVYYTIKGAVLAVRDLASAAGRLLATKSDAGPATGPVVVLSPA